MGNGAREDVCKRGDAACGAGCETADEEVGLSAKGGKGGGWEGRGETGDFADLGTSEFGADDVLSFFNNELIFIWISTSSQKKTAKIEKKKRKKRSKKDIPHTSPSTPP